MTRLSLQCYVLALLLFLVSLGGAGWAAIGAVVALGAGLVLMALDVLGGVLR